MQCTKLIISMHAKSQAFLLWVQRRKFWFSSTAAFHEGVKIRVRIGYGILEKLCNFRKEIPYNVTG